MKPSVKITLRVPSRASRKKILRGSPNNYHFTSEESSRSSRASRKKFFAVHQITTILRQKNLRVPSRSSRASREKFFAVHQITTILRQKNLRVPSRSSRASRKKILRGLPNNYHFTSEESSRASR